MQRQLQKPILWTQSRLVPYAKANLAMEAHVAAMLSEKAGPHVWSLQHPPVYTAGVSSNAGDVLAPLSSIPLISSKRGGKITYHDPGQCIVYLMLDMRCFKRDVRAYVGRLQDWLIESLRRLGLCASTHPEHVGCWVAGAYGGYDKIAALGVRIRRHVAYHGIALNVDPDLAAYGAIVPCGINEPGLGITSLRKLGLAISIEEATAQLRACFADFFGPFRDTDKLPGSAA